MINLSLDENSVATLTLDDPQSRNAMSPSWGKRFRAVAESLDRREVRVVVIQATGTHFSVGGDVSFFAAAANIREDVYALAVDVHAGLLALSALSAPLIASVQGPAAGAGLGLILASDFAIATEAASFVVAYTAIGLSPDVGCTYWLPRRVGSRRATELTLSNRRVDAAEAERIGILTEVVDGQDMLSQRVAELADGLAAGPLTAHGAVKQLAEMSWNNTLAQQLDAEAQSIAELAASPTGAEGIAAFTERRRPWFNRLEPNVKG